MRRRDLLGLVGGAMMLPPLAVAAQQNETAFALGRAPRIGFIAPGSQDAAQGFLDAFREGLQALDSEAGSNPVIFDRWAEGQAERLPGIAKQLIGSQIDALVTVGSPATIAARSVTSRVPIVFVAVADPVGQQIVNSMARPGGNATGLALDSLKLITMRLQLLQDVVPKLSRLAVIVRNDPGLEQRLLDIRRFAEPMAIKVREFEAPTGQALQLAFMWLVNDRSDAIYVASGPLGPAKRAEIISLAAKARIPAIYPFRAFPAAGGLMSFGTDEKDLFRRAAITVGKILKGSKPSELPVEQPTKFELIINLKTAKTLGSTVPHRSSPVPMRSLNRNRSAPPARRRYHSNETRGGIFRRPELVSAGQGDGSRLGAGLSPSARGTRLPIIQCEQGGRCRITGLNSYHIATTSPVAMAVRIGRSVGSPIWVKPSNALVRCTEERTSRPRGSASSTPQANSFTCGCLKGNHGRRNRGDGSEPGPPGQPTPNLH